MIKKSRYQILLYYKYTTIKNPEKFVADRKKLCQKLGLTGRIIVAHEGINGTVEGLIKNTRAYVRFMTAKRQFKDIHWKKSEGTGASFPRLSIKARPEIVSLSLSKRQDIDPRKLTGKYLSPKILKEWFKKGEEFTIIDMRNSYEHKVGAFEGSILPPMKNFRDLPKVINTLKPYKKQKVLTVCTGGVRCEKASGFLLKKGFKDVYQLQGGIVSFMEKYPDGHFKGSLYVFDGRTTMAFNPKKGKRSIIGLCESCGAKTERFIDISRNGEKEQILECETCAHKKRDSISGSRRDILTTYGK